VLAPLEDPAGLADAMTRLVTMSPAERQHLADAGHATVQREHHEDAVVAAYLAMYAQLRGRPEP
jgi:predicted RNase H-like nuclease